MGMKDLSDGGGKKERVKKNWEGRGKEDEAVGSNAEGPNARRGWGANRKREELLCATLVPRLIQRAARRRFEKKKGKKKREKTQHLHLK